MSDHPLRYRRGIVLAVTGQAAGIVAFAALRPVPGFGTGAAVLVALLGAALVDGLRHRRPGAVFVIEDHAFRTPRYLSTLFVTLTLVQMTALAGAATILAIGQPGYFWFGFFATVGLALSAGFQARGMWHGIGLTLRPSGIHAGTAAGTLTVPWEALTAHLPDARMTLRYRRPELVVSTGWVYRLDRLAFDGVDGRFLAAVIQHYAAHPGRRHAIGTAAENARLDHELPVVVKPDLNEPLTTAAAIRRAVIGLAVFLTAIALQALWEDAHPVLGHVLSFPALLGIAMMVTAVHGWRAQRRITRVSRLIAGRDDQA